MATPPAPPTALARWRAPVAAATIAAALFATIFLAALGDPRPHQVPVAVAGSAEEARNVQAWLDELDAGAFDVRQVDQPDAARALLHDRSVYGVLEATDDPRLWIAAFNGAALNTVVEGHVSYAAANAGVAGDAGSLPTFVAQADEGKPASTFYVVFGMVIAAMAFTVASGTLSPTAAAFGTRQRVLAALVTAVMVGAAVGAIAWAFDALPGSYVGVAAIAALLMLGLVLCVEGIVLLLGLPGLVLSAVFFVMVGNAVSGAAVHPLLLGDGWRQLSPLIPTGAGATAIIEVAAFEEAALVGPLLVLAGWAAIGFVLVTLGGRRRPAPAAVAP